MLRYGVEVQVSENSVISISKPLLICFPDLGISDCLIALEAEQLSHCRPGRAAFLRLT